MTTTHDTFYDKPNSHTKNTLRIMLMSHIAQTLNTNSIEHLQLRFTSNTVDFPTIATYTNLTDESHIFIKFLDDDEETNNLLLQREIDFANIAEYGDVPLLNEVQSVPHFGEDEETIYYSVWEWDERIQQAYYEETWATAAARELAEFHTISPNVYSAISHYNHSLTDETYYGKLLRSSSITSFVGLRTSSLLQNIYINYIQKTSMFLRSAAQNSDWVISHGQLDLDNIVTLKRNHSMRLANCMYIRIAPREYDLAFLYYRLVLEKHQLGLWEIFLAEYEKTTKAYVNMELILQFIKVLLSEILIEKAANIKNSFQSVSIENFINDRFIPVLQTQTLSSLSSLF